MSYLIDPEPRRHGVLLRREGAGLCDLPTAALRDLFLAHGLVLWRGFDAGPADFAALAARFTASYFIGYGRQVFPDHPVITTVNEAPQPLGPHCDNGMRPDDQRPEITWFYCQAPSQQGGQTTIFDGAQVLSLLSDTARQALTAQDIAFHTRYAEPAWRKMGYKDPDAFGRFLATLGSTQRRVLADGTVEAVVLAPAVRKGRFCGRPSFVSSLRLAGMPGFESLRVTWADGSPIPQGLIAEIDAALGADCEEIAWQPGDVARLDNTRFLHGRRPYTDLGRRLYLIQTLRVNF